MFGIQEQKQELHGLMQLYIQNHMVQNMIAQQMVLFQLFVGQNGLGQTKFFEHEVGTDQVNEDGSTTTVSSFVKSYDIDLEQRQRNEQGRASGPKVAGEVFLAMRRFCT